MTFALKHFGHRPTPALDNWIRSEITALHPRLQIDDARVRVAYFPESSPGYHVHVHLVTPGPDLLVESRDYTVRAAFSKVMRALREKIGQRDSKRLQRVKSNLSAPAARTRARKNVAMRA